MKRDLHRSIRNWMKWTSNVDHEGNTPLDLLSTSLAIDLRASQHQFCCTSIMSFGKADFPLGIQLPKTSVDVVRPRRIDQLQHETVVLLGASKYHSIAVTKEGTCYTWGHGKSGRLGHGDEVTQPDPVPIRALAGHVVRVIATSENHTLAITESGDLFSWGSNRFGQLGHGGEFAQAPNSSFSSFSPKKVKAMQKMIVVGIAAGDFHSVCYTADAEVFCPEIPWILQ